MYVVIFQHPCWAIFLTKDRLRLPNVGDVLGWPIRVAKNIVLSIITIFLTRFSQKKFSSQRVKIKKASTQITE